MQFHFLSAGCRDLSSNFSDDSLFKLSKKFYTLSFIFRCLKQERRHKECISMERTFVMMKPGVIQRRIAGEILNRFEKKGLQLVGLKLMMIDSELAKKHYAEHEKKPFFHDLVQYVTSGPVIAMAFEGDEAVALVRKLCGATAALNAEPGTIRGDYSMHTNSNIIHSSDSVENAERELKLFFKSEEFFPWKDGNQDWF